MSVNSTRACPRAPGVGRSRLKTQLLPTVAQRFREPAMAITSTKLDHCSRHPPRPSAGSPRPWTRHSSHVQAKGTSTYYFTCIMSRGPRIAKKYAYNLKRSINCPALAIIALRYQCQAIFTCRMLSVEFAAELDCCRLLDAFWPQRFLD